jgi:hypothetical protein
MLSQLPHWPSSQAMLDLRVLEKLKWVRSTWQQSIPMQFYQGDIDGIKWRIDIRTDLMLPTLIEYKNRNETQSTRLRSAYPLEQAPWQPVSTVQYDGIDYADFSDRENDPLVKHIEGLLGLRHAHGHQHTH